MFVGWDWASTTHDVTVIDDAGNIVDRWAPEHTELGLEATLARLTRHGPPEQWLFPCFRGSEGASMAVSPA